MKTLTINNKLISIVSATLLTIMFVFSSHANAATKTTVSTKFDHTQTGFILKDVHLTLRCEQCHVDGIFKNTPKDCSGCHAVGTRVGATPQPINHVQTTAACDTCHTSTANFQVKAFNHLSVTNKCSTCHNSQSLGVLSKPASHIPTNLPCEQCHKNTTTFVSWQMGTTGHAGITSGCYQCHGGPAGEPGPVGTFTNVVSFNAATHIPITVNGVAADCNACHTGFTNFLGAVYNHASVIFTPGSNSTPRCSSCHSGQTVGVKAVPPIPANHITIPAGNDCSVCHFYTTPGGFLGATYNHAGVQTGSCDTCHTGAYPGVLTKGSSHITTQSYKCDACHTNINTLNYTSFAGSTYHGAPGVTVTAGSCSTCHDGSKTAAPELAQGLTSATNHIPTSNAACDVCHTSTNTSQYSTFKNSVYHQTVLTPGTCTTCHNGNFTAWNALGMPAGTGHIPTTASCDSCHTAANTQNYTAFTGAIYHQVVTNPGTCITCHTGTFGSPNSALNPMGMGGNHITQTDTDCAKCHTKNNTSNYTVFTGALYHQGVTSPPAGGCLTCHDGSKTSENAQGKSSLIGLGHIPTTASPSCDTCHTSINTIGYTTFQWAEYHEEVPLPGTCITCHTGTFSSANSALNPQAMGPNHITPTDTDCGKCHTKNNTSNYTVFTGTRYHQGVISPGVCNTCHDGSKTSEFALGLPAGNAHIPTSGATCDTCHSATNTLGYTTFQWAVYHQQVTSPGTCTTCHTGTGAGTYIDATAALNPLPISTPHIQISGYSCGTCHTSGNTNGYNAFTGASYHLAVSAPAGGCLTCHNASLGVPASGNGLVPQLTSNASGGHITVTGTSCDLCHTAFNTSYFTSFTGTTYHGSVNATGTLCSSCHSGTTATLSSNGLAPQTSLQALNLSGLDHTTFSTACETCHTSSNTSQFSTFLGATYHPTGAAATGTCANAGCHVATNINPSGPLGINYQLDIFYFHQIPFLLSYSDPLHLLVVDQLSKGEKAFQHLSKLVIDHISLYRSEGFYINTIVTDNEPSMTALKSVIHGSGARHVTGGVKANTLAKIDRSIRLIKDRVRSILHSLPYSLPLKLLPWVISFAVSRINLLNHSFSTGGQASPRELFCGRKVDFNRDVRVAFGDYCEVFLPETDNSMKERSHSCLALCPTNNKSGSVLFHSLSTGKVIKGDRWKHLNITPEVINSINRMSKDSAPANPEFLHRGRIIDDSPTELPQLPPLNTQSQQYLQVMDLPPIQLTISPPSEPTEPLFYESSSPLDTPSVDSPLSEPEREDQPPIVNSEPSILPPRLRRKPPGLDDYEIYNVSITDALKDAPELVNQAIALELDQMLSKKVFHPVKSSPIRPIPSKMFLKRKIDSKGNTIKWKARLVAGGHRQHPDDTVIRSSPTVHHNSFMIASLIAANSNLSVASVDITGAYLLVDMTSEVL